MSGGIYGLSGSGLDIDSMVKKAMQGQTQVVNQLIQKQTQAQWKKDAYNTVYKDISDFRDAIFNYKLSNTLSPRKITSSDDKVVTATANDSAVNVAHSLIVSKLAGGVQKTSAAAITPNGATKDTITNQLYGGSAPTDPITITVTNGSQQATLSVDPSKSLTEFISQINNAGINVQASYDVPLDRVFLYTSNTGASSGLSFDGSSAAGLDFLQNKLHLDTSAKTGQDAEFSLDGAALKEDSNTFSIAGVKYSLTGLSPTTTDGTNTPVAATVTVAPDIDQTVTNVKALVDSYNKILAEINGKLKETKYKDYLPLTDDQKAAMKDSDITAWDVKAKSGLLSRDSILSELVNNLRSAISAPVTGVTGYNTTSSIGLTTSTYTEDGKLYLDETKLRTALTEDPDAVKKIFTTTGDTTNSEGVVNRLYDTLKTTMGKLVDTAGTSDTAAYDTQSAMAKQINDYTTRITAAKSRAQDMEEAYYKQFDAMETMLSQLNQQSSWLSQQLGTSK